MGLFFSSLALDLINGYWYQCEMLIMKTFPIFSAIMYQYFLTLAMEQVEQPGSMPTGMPILNYMETNLRRLLEMGLALRLTIWK